MCDLGQPAHAARCAPRAPSLLERAISARLTRALLARADGAHGRGHRARRLSLG